MDNNVLTVDVLVDQVRQFQRLIVKHRRTRRGFRLLIGVNGLLILMTALQLITFPTVVYLGNVTVGWWLLIRLGQLIRQINELMVDGSELTDLKQQSIVWYLRQGRVSLGRSYRRECLYNFLAILNSTLCGLAWHLNSVNGVVGLLLIPFLFLWLRQSGNAIISDRLMTDCRQHLGLVKQLTIEVLTEHPGLVGPASISRIGPDDSVTAERGLSPAELVSVSVPNG